MQYSDFATRINNSIDLLHIVYITTVPIRTSSLPNTKNESQFWPIQKVSKVTTTNHSSRVRRVDENGRNSILQKLARNNDYFRLARPFLLAGFGSGYGPLRKTSDYPEKFPN